MLLLGCIMCEELVYQSAGTSKVISDSLPHDVMAASSIDWATLQVELHYPPAKDRPPMQPASGAGTSAKASKSKRPRFCDVLARSLRPQAELRAWFDEQLGYQPVQQTRIPLNMPNVGHHKVSWHITNMNKRCTHML